MPFHTSSSTSDPAKGRRRTGSLFSRRGSLEPANQSTAEHDALPKIQSATPIMRSRRVSHDHTDRTKQQAELRKVQSATPVARPRRASHEPSSKMNHHGSKASTAPSRTRSNAYDKVKRLSHSRLTLDGGAWHHLPGNTTLAALEAAMATHPQDEILTAIGRSQSLRPSSSERRRYPITYQTTDQSAQAGPPTPRKNISDSSLATMPAHAARRRASSMIMPNIQAVRQLTVATHNGNVSSLRSKYASPLLQAEQNSRKPIMRLRIPSIAPTPPLKPVKSLLTRELPPIPVEISIDLDTRTQSSALSSPAMIIDDSNLILHYSVTSPLMRGSGPSYPRISNAAQEIQILEGSTVGYGFEDIFEPISEGEGTIAQQNPALIAPETGSQEQCPAINTTAEHQLDTNFEPENNADMMTFFAAESDSEDEDEDAGESSGSSGQTSMTSYEFPSPQNGLSNTTTPDSMEVCSADKCAEADIPSTTTREIPVMIEEAKPLANDRKITLYIEDQTDVNAVLRSRRISKVTWSQAQGELESHLFLITGQQDALTPATATPPLPRRSFRRHFQQAVRARNFSRPLLSRRSTTPASVQDGPCVRALKRRNSDDFTHNPSDLSNRRLSSKLLSFAEEMINPDVAEDVVFQILSGLDSFDDLFACAMTNKGFYSVFKRSELALMKIVLHNKSPAAWELRETSPKQIIACEGIQTDYTPKTYHQFLKRDTYVIDSLKRLILSRCQSFLRPETINALRGQDASRANEINNAFWRVWTFCLLFGSEKGREEDLVGQMDWLRGGALAHQATCSSTIVWSEPIDMTSILLNPPESFGGGNGDGLSTDELHDMTEIWNCLKALLYGILGEKRLAQAKENGVFDGIEAKDGDAPTQELMLEEWLYHLTTLGLSAVLDLATPSTSAEPTVFVVAREMGWTDWTPPPNGGSRSTFLKEAVTRVYEEKLLRSRTPEQESEEEEESKIRQYRKLRSALVAAELKEKKRGTDYSKTPISEDRPMSMWEDWQARLEITPYNKQAFTTITEEEVPPSPGIVHPAFRQKAAATPKRSSTKSSHHSRKATPGKRSPTSSSRTHTHSHTHTHTHNHAHAHAHARKDEKPKQHHVPKTDKAATKKPALVLAPAPAPKRSSLSPPKPTRKAAAGTATGAATTEAQIPPRTSSASAFASSFSRFSPSARNSAQSKPQPQSQPQPQPQPQPSKPASALRLKRPATRFPGMSMHRKPAGSGAVQVPVAAASPPAAAAAVARMVDMGFAKEEARRALEATEAGDVLDVDRAVGWLLGRDEGSGKGGSE